MGFSSWINQNGTSQNVVYNPYWARVRALFILSFHIEQKIPKIPVVSLLIPRVGSKLPKTLIITV